MDMLRKKRRDYAKGSLCLEALYERGETPCLKQKSRLRGKPSVWQEGIYEKKAVSAKQSVIARQQKYKTNRRRQVAGRVRIGTDCTALYSKSHPRGRMWVLEIGIRDLWDLGRFGVLVQAFLVRAE